MRIWFPNAPDAADSKSDRSQIAIGISLTTTPSQAEIDNGYFRRYLDDPKFIGIVLPTTPVEDEEPGELNEYIRRYLGDPR